MEFHAGTPGFLLSPAPLFLPLQPLRLPCGSPGELANCSFVGTPGTLGDPLGTAKGRPSANRLLFNVQSGLWIAWPEAALGESLPQLSIRNGGTNTSYHSDWYVVANRGNPRSFIHRVCSQLSVPHGQISNVKLTNDQINVLRTKCV